MARSAVAKIRELDAQRAKLIAAAKSDAINKVDKALKELNSLGFDYRIVADGSGRSIRVGRKRKAGRGKGRVKNAACKICNFVTVPPHDARTHRSQAKKAPFSSQELAQRGLRRRNVR
jgi:hypothetical protein